MFKRYANPMILLNQMIKSKRFSEYVNEFVSMTNEELESQTKWEFWLHRVLDMSYADFLAKTEMNASSETVTKNELESTVKDSWDICQSFVPS